MPVQNIECQIARAQLGRYLAGDGMAGEAIRQLEAHINKCPECKAVLEEKRSSLVATLEGAPKAHPAMSASRSGLDPKSSASRLAQAIMAKSAEMASTPSGPAPRAQVAPQPAPTQAAVEITAKPVFNWKPIAYAGALAAVLIAMSYLGKADILGGKATNVLPERPDTAPSQAATHAAAVPAASPSPTPSPSAAASPSPTPTPVSTPAPKAVAIPVVSKTVPAATTTKPASTTKPADNPTTKTTTPAKAITPPAPKPAAKIQAKLITKPIHHAPIIRPRIRHYRPAPIHRAVRVHRAPHARIRIYDASGNAIN